MPWHQEPMKDVISCGEEQVSYDPQISEWSNPHEYAHALYGE